MNSNCPYKHVSYAAWKWQTLRWLYNAAEPTIRTQFSFLNPLSVNLPQTRSFHESRPRTRYYVDDLKRTAKFKRVQLELTENTKPHADVQSTTPLSRPSQTRNDVGEWNPYDDDSLQELQNLVGALKLKSRQAAEKADAKEEEGIPFEHSVVYSRKKPNRPESPFERRRPWDRPMKLQVHEVEVDKRLENNVWAQILASPMRMDRGSRARLPRDLMMSWGIMRNPKDGEDYVLPIEFSDLNALQQELRQGDDTITSEELLHREQRDPSIHLLKSQPAMRLQITGNKILLESISDDLTHVQRTKIRGDEIKTLTGKLTATIVPHRWRLKQDELKAFHRTREAFNERLHRKPDEDEPNLGEMAKLDTLQWQPDIANRIERIMKERLLIILEAVASGNASGRAIHDRRLLALPIPEHGRFYLNEKGNLVENKSVDPGSFSESSQEDGSARTARDPGYVHGSIFVHIGPPESYRNTTERWHQQNVAERHEGLSVLEEMPFYNIIPPMIPVNDQYRIPVFNLQTLLGNEHTDRLQQLIRDHEILDLNFWQQRNTGPIRGERGTGPESFARQTSPGATPRDVIPDSPLDAGEQVLSSIITPKLNVQPSQPDNPSNFTSSHAAGSATSPDEEADTPYLILIKPRSKHGNLLIREVWQLWRYLGGRDGLFLDSSTQSGELIESESESVEQKQSVSVG